MAETHGALHTVAEYEEDHVCGALDRVEPSRWRSLLQRSAHGPPRRRPIPSTSAPGLPIGADMRLADLTHAGHPAAPIFVAGIYPRSGTNHLVDLLCAHPDCASPAPIWEDYLLAHAGHLEAYAEAVSRHWNPSWGAGDADRRALLSALGGGIAEFLRSRAKAPRVVTKTPSVAGLAHFAALFPDAHLLVLVRDGRAVVESGVRSFGWFRDGAIHGWARAARDLLAFEANARVPGLRYLRVHYEELVGQPEATLRGLMDFLGLDAARYDFARAASLPVRGSSTEGRSAGGRVRWRGVERTADFAPIERFRHWSRAQHARFEWIAGDALRALGYASEAPPDGPGRAVWNRLLDLRLHAALGLPRFR
jgi:hypothetical protein